MNFLFKPWASWFDIVTIYAVYSVCVWLGTINFWLAIAFGIPTSMTCMFLSVLAERKFVRRGEKGDQ